MLSADNQRATRVLVRKQHTGMYLQRSGKFSGNQEQAMDFATAAFAHSFALSRKLGRVEIVRHGGDGNREVVLLRIGHID